MLRICRERGLGEVQRFERGALRFRERGVRDGAGAASQRDELW